MLHDTQQQRETVPVEAGLVADVGSGQVRSETMDAHYSMLEQSINERRANKQKRARIAKVAWLSVFLALPAGGAVFYFNSDEAQKLAGEAIEDMGMVTDSEKMAEEYDAALEIVEKRGELIENGAFVLGVDPNAPINADRNATFDGQISDFAGGERTSIERERDLRERFSPVKSADD